MPRRPTLRLFATGLGVLAACGSGSRSSPLDGDAAPIELVACRARTDSPFQFAEIALRSGRNLGSGRVADRVGTERGARLHPDAQRVVFARERQPGSAASRELFVSSIDGSTGERQLTANGVRDDEPCWSPDGARVLFTSARSGDAALWIADADGANAAPFVAPPAGGRDGEADWCATTDRVVFVRTIAGGTPSLWLANGGGGGLVPLTDGALGLGDHAPAFAPDGSRIAFARELAPGRSALCVVDVATFAVTTLLQPDGEITVPRWAPAMDRLFFGLAEPDRGRAARRLATLPFGAGTPTLLWPDERWQLEGIDVLPVLPPLPTALPPEVLPVTGAQVQVASGSGVFGSRTQLAAADGDEFVVWTATFEEREVAGINCRYDLPVADALDVLELRIRAVARTTRADPDAFLRMSIYNPVDERFDTAVELVADDTTARTMEFRTASLRHVTREKQLRVTVIADVPDGETAELHVDLVEVTLVARAGP